MDTFLPTIEGEPTTLIVNKSNALIAGQGRLTTNQSKLLLLSIGLVNPKQPQRDDEGYIFAELSHHEIAQRLDTEVRYVKRFIQDACTAYHSVAIHLKAKGSEPASTINIAHRSIPLTDDGTFKIQFHKRMEEHIIDLAEKGYAAYDFKYIRYLDSKHTIKLYELLAKAYNKSKGGTQITRISLKDMWYSMGLTDDAGHPMPTQFTYISSYAEFNRRVLKAAVEEVNGVKKSVKKRRKKELHKGTDLRITYAPYRGRGEFGRQIAGVTFCMTPVAMDHASATVESLAKLGIKIDIAEKIAAVHEADVIKRNVAYFQKVHDGGLEVKSTVGLLRYFIENDVAGLPSVANPYSDEYKGNAPAIKFVKKCVMPIWGVLPKSLQAEIIEDGLMFHPKIGPDFRGFIAMAKSNDFDTAELFYSGDHCIDSWTN